VQAQKIKTKFFLIIFTLIFLSCEKNQPFPENSPYDGQLTLSNGQKVFVNLANTEEKRKNGLSGVLPSSFKSNQGMLFVYQKTTLLKFWMIDTYFNLDIIYLDEDFKVVKVTKNLPHHPGYSNTPPIAKDKPVYGMYALEIRNDANLTQDIKTGDQFKWSGKKPLPKVIKN
jgi:uncharacterized membrane protein (UPF0127 family)